MLVWASGVPLPAKVSTSPVSVAAAAAPVNEARGVSGGSGSGIVSQHKIPLAS